jgi:hypothetical protein
MKRNILEGKEFGFWTVQKYDSNSKWVCLCKCGNIRSVSGKSLLSNESKSCGCSRKHMLAFKSEKGIYNGMINRCTNANYRRFYDYGGRGIKVCDRWLELGEDGFSNFLADMGERPSKNHSLDRINNDGDYIPENCRWATKKEQSNNRRNNRRIVINDECQTLTQWCENLSINIGKLYRLGRENIETNIKFHIAGLIDINAEKSDVGHHNSRASLTKSEAQEVKLLAESGVSYAKITKKFNITKSTITRIKKGQRYANI